MPLVAQVTGAVALTALIMGPWWSRVSAPAPDPTRAASATNAPVRAAAAPDAATATAAASPATVERPAHLNLDVRHSFASVDLLVTVDGKLALETKLEGSGKKFKMFGKRAARSFTRTLDLQPGVRVVRVRVQSPEDRFDQTRAERFDVASASVAALRIGADKATGLVVRADRPAEATPHAPPARSDAPPPAAASLPAAAAGTPPSITQQANALAALLNSLRSMLIAIAGFVASAATGFVVQEFLRAKKRVMFARGEDVEAQDAQRQRRRSQVIPAIEP
jgi:hypothetical protein